MKNKLTGNLVLKIGSVLFAAILWLLVTNINDPATSSKFSNIPVVIQNADAITSQGKVYEILDETDIIDSVTVVAPRSIIDTISKENVVAVADMNDLTSLNTISIRLSTNKYNDRLDSITGNIDSVKLNIEDKQSISLALRATYTGSVGDGYMVGDVTTEQNLVRVSGAESIVSRINKAEVSVAVTGFTSDIGTVEEIKLYDANDVEIPKTNLTLNISTVRVNVEILATKEVPLNFSVMGTPADGYRATGVVSSTPASVVLAGKGSMLKNISSLDIPDTSLDIAGLTENLVTTINVGEYLPGNVELGDKKFDGNVAVTVYIEPVIARNFIVSKDYISILNMPEGYEGEVSTFENEFPIQVIGLSADVNSINGDEIRGTVDIADLRERGIIEEVEEGYWDVPLSFNLPENVGLRENVTVRLNIREKE
ncbi:YbbR domain-containing protein [Kineothrix alysoides]|uniref:YbbR domain-containing protein n=1 Tax=Kineothrix alysoides TaxID=1469948 RepID=A0A4R1R2F1_9FIRM|nr:CdaR family protein [Kineothrix alysoides]TCL59472.1 YbbR domain-containing protein [Kineothrix alysoides]